MTVILLRTKSSSDSSLLDAALPTIVLHRTQIKVMEAENSEFKNQIVEMERKQAEPILMEDTNHSASPVIASMRRLQVLLPQAGP